jgi:hypothetical protein
MNRDIINGLIEANFLDTNYRIQNLPKTIDEIIDVFNKNINDRGGNTETDISRVELLKEVWLLLQNSGNSMNSDNKSILDILSKAGLANQDDLPLLSADSIKQISNFLKIVPKKKFLSIMAQLKS